MITLYSTHCPKCKLLEKQLQKLNTEYEVIDDKKVMLDMGFQSAPKLEVNGRIMDYQEAIKWVMGKIGGRTE